MRSDSSASLAKSLLRIEGEILHAGLSVIAEPISFVPIAPRPDRCPAFVPIVAPRPPARQSINPLALAAFWRGSALQIRAEPKDGDKAAERLSEEAGRDVSPRRSVAQGRGGGGVGVGRRAELDAFAPTPRHPPAGPVLVRKAP